MNKSLQVYTGSPGVKTDFSLLINNLSESLSKNPTLAMAYSFGCRQALLDASHKKNESPLILIAPYLFPTNSPSLIKKAVLRTPLLGDKVLSLLGPKSIKQFLTDSSHPAPVTQAYRDQSKLYLAPKLLKKSILEKEVSDTELAQSLKSIHTNKKICLIRGENDKTSPFEEQIKPILENLNIREFIIPNAGHALIWTHPKEVAEIINNYLEKFYE
jgi:pimeloyl-ACP methyl ester carboxylesterase